MDQSDGTERDSQVAMRMDAAAIPAPSALTRLREIPSMGLDEHDRPFATSEDRDDRGGGGRSEDQPADSMPTRMDEDL